MLSRLWAIAVLTMIEVRRSRAMGAVMVVMLLLLLTAAALASVTMGRTVDIVVDFGLAGMSVTANILAIIITVQLTQQERENRTLYLMLPRVAHRSVYIWGKFFGIALVLALLVLAMSVLLIGFAAFFGWSKWQVLMQACLMSIPEVWIAIALALLFSNASSMFLAIFLTVAVDIAGRFSFVIKKFGEAVGGAVEWFTDAAYYLLPNLQAMDLRSYVIDFPAVSAVELAQMFAYGITEIALVLMAACLLFMNKDLQAS